MKEFEGHIVRVFEFTSNGDVLVINAAATGMAMFEAKDVGRKFECREYNNVLMLKHLNPIEQMLYWNKVVSRNGGYNEICKQLVIASSLHKGEFTDNVLFQK